MSKPSLRAQKRARKLQQEQRLRGLPHEPARHRKTQERYRQQLRDYEWLLGAQERATRERLQREGVEVPPSRPATGGHAS